jgi:hypothetical protein
MKKKKKKKQHKYIHSISLLKTQHLFFACFTSKHRIRLPPRPPVPSATTQNINAILITLRINSDFNAVSMAYFVFIFVEVSGR